MKSAKFAATIIFALVVVIGTCKCENVTAAETMEAGVGGEPEHPGRCTSLVQRKSATSVSVEL